MKNNIVITDNHKYKLLCHEFIEGIIAENEDLIDLNIYIYEGIKLKGELILYYHLYEQHCEFRYRGSKERLHEVLEWIWRWKGMSSLNELKKIEVEEELPHVNVYNFALCTRGVNVNTNGIKIKIKIYIKMDSVFDSEIQNLLKPSWWRYENNLFVFVYVLNSINFNL